MDHKQSNVDFSTFLLNEVLRKNPSEKQLKLAKIVGKLLTGTDLVIDPSGGRKLVDYSGNNQIVNKAYIPEDYFDSSSHEYDFHCSLVKFNNSIF
ncbi:hypothetical protein [Salmon gill poxvirus]